MTWLDRIRTLAADGYGWEDIMVRLKLTAPDARFVRAFVLDSGSGRVVEPSAAAGSAGGSTERERG